MNFLKLIICALVLTALSFYAGNMWAKRDNSVDCDFENVCGDSIKALEYELKLCFFIADQAFAEDRK